MHRVLIYAAAGCVAVALAAAANEPPKERRPQDEVPLKEWRRYIASTDIRPLIKTHQPGPFAGVGGIERAKDGALEAHSLFVYCPELGYRVPGRPAAASYPPVREGDLTPGFNSQVCEVGPLAMPNRGGPVTFTFATVLKPPPGTALRRGGWAVPIKQGTADLGYLESSKIDEKWRVWVNRVVVPAKGPPTADLSFDLWTWPRLAKATVRAGDVVRYDEFALRVVNVVPRNPKTRVIGWVEFDPKPLTPEKAKKAAAESGGKVVESTFAER